jgi:hypothetical protein
VLSHAVGHATCLTLRSSLGRGLTGLRVFISYRREDAIGIAGWIRDRLAQEFAADDVVVDIDTIPLGVDFRTHIDPMVM